MQKTTTIIWAGLKVCQRQSTRTWVRVWNGIVTIMHVPFGSKDSGGERDAQSNVSLGLIPPPSICFTFYYTVQIFLSPPVVLLSFISRFALVR